MSKVNLNDYLTKEEIQQLLKKSDWKAALGVLSYQAFDCHCYFWALA